MAYPSSPSDPRIGGRNCPACRHANLHGRRFCAQCGAPIALQCATCGFFNRPDDALCGGCGAASDPRLGRASEARASPEAQAFDAERRPITLLFCDLADASTLAHAVDPEQLHEILTAYRASCEAVVARYGGLVARFIHDGMLAYFGFPAAQEDDACRAVGAALEILATVAALPEARAFGLERALAVRMGIDTGDVVAGEGGVAGTFAEVEVFGDVPNIAARLQSLAAPGQVLISERTARLVEGLFVLEAEGPRGLKGIGRPVHTFRPCARNALSRFEARARRGLTPLIGREPELGILSDRWSRARAGTGQTVVLVGEAGIGKTRIVHAFRERLPVEPIWQLELHGSALHRTSALFPLTELLARSAGILADDSPDRKRAKLDADMGRLGLNDFTSLAAALLGLSAGDGDEPLELSPQQHRRRLRDGIAAMLAHLSRSRPVLLAVEDAHWLDPSTLEFLSVLHEESNDTSLLTLVTCRPDAETNLHGVDSGHVTRLTITRLGPDEARALVRGMPQGATLPAGLVDEVVRTCDGVPLYLEEVTREILEGAEAPDWEHDPGSPHVPPTLKASLMARLDRLGPVKPVAQLAATIGREFTQALLAAVAQAEPASLDAALDTMVHAGILTRQVGLQETTFRFKHALIEEAAYANLVKRQRALHHAKIAETLAASFPHLVEGQPEILAQHFSRADRPGEAAAYWRRAGERAAGRAANREAIAHFEHGLADLMRTPPGRGRDAAEHALRLRVAACYVAIRGWSSAEAETQYRLAHALAERLDDTGARFAALRGLTNVHLLRGEMAAGWKVVRRVQRLADTGNDERIGLSALRLLGACSLYSGRFAATRAHLAAVLARFRRSDRGEDRLLHAADTEVVALCLGAWPDWFLGMPGEALGKLKRARHVTAELGHAFSTAYFHALAAQVHATRHDPHLTLEHSDAAIALSEELEFAYWSAIARVTRGWAIGAAGSLDEGIGEIERGLVACEASGAHLLRTFGHTLLAELQLASGQADHALATLDRITEQERQVTFFRAETLRVRAETLDALGRLDAEVERCLRSALAIARRQGARALQFRVNATLARRERRISSPGPACRSLRTLSRRMAAAVDQPDRLRARELLADLG